MADLTGVHAFHKVGHPQVPTVCGLFPLGHSVLQTILYKRANDLMASTIHVSSLACMHSHAVTETQLAPPAGLGLCWASDPKWL